MFLYQLFRLPQVDLRRGCVPEIMNAYLRQSGFCEQAVKSFPCALRSEKPPTWVAKNQVSRYPFSIFALLNGAA